MSPNEPAFPRPISHLPPGTDEWADSQKGMTIRYEFAKAAMQGLLANPDCASDGTEFVAQVAIDYADAVLEKLAQKD